VAQQIHGYHRQGMAVAAFLDDVLRVLVLHAEVLSEAERLRLQPCLLQFNEDEMLAAVFLANRGSEVDAEHRERVALVVGILVGTNLHARDVLLEQSREDGSRDALVFHQVFEYDVVNGVCYCHHDSFPFAFRLQI